MKVGISGPKAAMFWMAVRGGHLRQEMSPRATKFWLAMSLAPVLVMSLSLPLALVSTTAALWLRQRVPGDLIR